jgi:uncharacterized membrane protein
MTVMPLDTHAYFKKLVATGLSETQAEAIASGLISGLTENLATKEELHNEIALLRGDMNAMESRLRGEMAELSGDLRGEMGAMEARLLRWGAVGLLSIIAVNLAMTGMMFTILNP